MNLRKKKKKNELASIGNKADQMEGRTSKIKNKNLEMMQRER